MATTQTNDATDPKPAKCAELGHRACSGQTYIGLSKTGLLHERVTVSVRPPGSRLGLLHAHGCGRAPSAHVDERIGSGVLVQLSGVPGSGKSRLARSIAEATGFVVVDTDVLKSSIVGSGVPVAAAGPVTYGAALALAQDLLEQGRTVVLDSPCRYRQLLDSGRRKAGALGVRYAFIELWVRDWSVVLGRLDERSPRVSQVASATAPVPGTEWEFGTPAATLEAWQNELIHPEHDWL